MSGLGGVGSMGERWEIASARTFHSWAKSSRQSHLLLEELFYQLIFKKTGKFFFSFLCSYGNTGLWILTLLFFLVTFAHSVFCVLSLELLYRLVWSTLNIIYSASTAFSLWCVCIFKLIMVKWDCLCQATEQKWNVRSC